MASQIRISLKPELQIPGRVLKIYQPSITERNITLALIVIGILISFLLFFVLIATLFINGIFTIQIDLIFARNQTGFWDFFTETAGWSTEHHITNFVFMVFWASSVLYLIPYLKPPTHLVTYFITIVYISAIGLSLIYAMCGELLEQSGRKIMRRILNDANFETFTGYSSETVDDVILSDVVQGFLAPLGALLFLIFILKPTSVLLFHKAWYITAFRVVIFIIFSPSGFITTLNKEFGGKIYHIGFYAQCFLKIGLVLILFLEDYLHIINLIKKYKKIKSTPLGIKSKIPPIDYVRLKVSNVIHIYIFVLIYLIIQWVSTLDLRTWGLPVSNFVTIVYFFILLPFRKYLK